MSVLQGKTLLIVDDETELRELIVEHFRFLKCSVFEAAGGHEAFEIFKTHPIDIVLTDLRMANGDGLGLIENIRQENLQNPLTILMTGFSDKSLEKLKHAPRTLVLNKPFRLPEMQKLIEQLCSEQTTDLS